MHRLWFVPTTVTLSGVILLLVGVVVELFDLD